MPEFIYIFVDKMPHKWMLVITIVGCISLFFLICFTIDFYLFRRRKRLARLRQILSIQHTEDALSAEKHQTQVQSCITADEYPENNSANVSATKNTARLQRMVRAFCDNKRDDACLEEQLKYLEKSRDRFPSDTGETVSTSVESVDTDDVSNHDDVQEDATSHIDYKTILNQVPHSKQTTRRDSLCVETTVVSLEETELVSFEGKHLRYGTNLALDLADRNLTTSLQNEYSNSIRDEMGQNVNIPLPDKYRKINSVNNGPSHNTPLQHEYRNSNSDNVSSNTNVPLQNEQRNNNRYDMSSNQYTRVQHEYRKINSNGNGPNQNAPLQHECRNNCSDNLSSNLNVPLQCECRNNISKYMGPNQNTRLQNERRRINSDGNGPNQKTSLQNEYRNSNSDNVGPNQNTRLQNERRRINSDGNGPDQNTSLQNEHRKSNSDSIDHSLNIPLQDNYRNRISNDHVVHVMESKENVFDNIGTDTETDDEVFDDTSRVATCDKSKRTRLISWEFLPRTDTPITMHEYRNSKSKSKPQTIKTHEFTRSASSKEMLSHSMKHVDSNYERKNIRFPIKQSLKRVNTAPIFSNVNGAFTVNAQLRRGFRMYGKEQNGLTPTDKDSNCSFKDSNTTHT